MPEDHGEVLSQIDLGALGRTMLEAARAAGIGVTVTLVEPPAPRNIYVNEAAAEIFGWSVQELLARDPMLNIAPREQGRVQARLERRAGGERGSLSYELVVQRKDGSEATVSVTASHASIDGRPAVFAFIVDLTARRKAEEHRVQSEARFRELIEIAPEPVSIIRDGHFVYVNPAYLTVLGYPDRPTLYATPIATLVDEQDRQMQVARESLILSQAKDVPSKIYKVRRYDGTTVLLEVNSAYFEYEGRPAVLGMARDVTMRKQLERQLIQADRLAALGTMAAGVAHEINNPLAYAMLNLEWIARKLPDVEHDRSSLPGLMAMLDEARHGAERVSTIVRELRSFSRVDGETRRLIDVAAVVQSAVKIAGHEIRHRASITTAFEPTRPVWANHARLEQVVINLMLNAGQAMHEERAERNEIRFTLREDADGRAVLEVFDNGDGIPPEVLPRIFDPFFTTKPVGEGTGLGLSICHGIVTSLGGQISAYVEPGVGTTFRVVLPTSDPTVDESLPGRSDAPPSSVQPTKGARVLVVDDEAPIATTLRELLAPEHEVVAATTAREAMTALAKTDFDVVFCDLMMPGASGIELYEHLKAERPGAERRVVFMTGGAFTSRTAEFLASVDNRRVEKPFSLGLIEQIVREMAGAACS
jgi:PAS domain S-box-containing protein